jgi:hypothetical protein
LIPLSAVGYVMKSRMAIRWRLTLWFVLILLVLGVLSGIVLNTLVHHYLYEDIDNNLRVYSARVHGTLNPQASEELSDYSVIHSKLPPINAFSSPGIYIQLIITRKVAMSDNLTTTSYRQSCPESKGERRDRFSYCGYR